MQLDPTPAQIAATLAAIAEALDMITAETWQREDDLAAGLRLTSERDGALLHLRYNPQMHRFVVSGLLWLSRPDQPSVNQGDYIGARPAGLTHAITASADKAPPAVAREIARRLLPEYRADRARALAGYQEENRRQQRCQEIAAELAASVRGETRPERRQNTEFYDGLEGIHIKGQVSSPESVYLDIRYIDADTARAVLQAIAGRA